MKYYIHKSAFVIFIIFLQISFISAQDKVGIGTLSPGYRLDVQGSPSSSGLINLYSKVNYLGNLDVRAIEGVSINADGYGYGGKFTGGYKGVDGFAQAGTYTGLAYGLY